MHIYANPTRFLALAKWLMPLLFWSGLVLSLGAVGWGLFMVPLAAASVAAIALALFFRPPTPGPAAT